MKDERERKRGDAAAAPWIRVLQSRWSEELLNVGISDRLFYLVCRRKRRKHKSLSSSTLSSRGAHARTHTQACERTKRTFEVAKKTCVLGLIVLRCVDLRVGQTDLAQRRLVRVRQRLLLKGLSVVGIVLKELLGGSAAADLMWMNSPLPLLNFSSVTSSKDLQPVQAPTRAAATFLSVDIIKSNKKGELLFSTDAIKCCIVLRNKAWINEILSCHQLAGEASFT